MRKFEVIVSYHDLKKNFIIQAQGPSSASESAVKRFKSQNKIKPNNEDIVVSIKQLNDD